MDGRGALKVIALALLLAGVVAAFALWRGDRSDGRVLSPASTLPVVPSVPSSVAVSTPAPSSTLAPSSGATTDAPVPKVRFRVLTVVAYGNLEPSRATVTKSQDDLPELWALRRAEGSPPTIDFTSEVVVSMVIPDDACPPELDGFDLAANVLSPVFVETVSSCDQPLIPRVFIVAIERTSLPAHAVLRLPGIERLHLNQEKVLLN